MALKTAKERIDHALRMAGKGRTDLAKELDISRGSVSDMLNKPGDPPVKYVEATQKITGFNLQWLLTGDGPENQLPPYYNEASRIGYESIVGESVVESGYASGKKIRTVAVPVDPEGNELITFVPVKAQAGYPRGFGDAEYIEKLPAYSLPGFSKGTLRMFQVSGDSMLQLGGGGLHDGDIVIAQYVEDFFSIRDNRVYVIVSSTKGVVVKRCINRLRDNIQILVCMSDNKNGNHPPFNLRPEHILEVWELRAFISKQLSLATDLYDVIGDMRAQMSVLNEKIHDLEKDGPKNKK